MKRALVTGGSGFVGRAIKSHLEGVGYRVDSLGLSRHNEIVWDLRQGVPSLGVDYSLVVHAAGKAHVVPHKAEDSSDFMRVNLSGTENLLAALSRSVPPTEGFVLISSVAVYGRERGRMIRETAERLATDPYGLSKRMAEDRVQSWGEKVGCPVGVLRLPLVAGLSAPGNLGSMIRAVRSGLFFTVNGGGARRSIVLREDIVEVIPALARMGGTYHVTGPNHPSYREIGESIASALGRPTPHDLPLWLVQAGAKVGDLVLQTTGKTLPLTTPTVVKMTETLTFDDRAARKDLGWAPRSVLGRTREWAC